MLHVFVAPISDSFGSITEGTYPVLACKHLVILRDGQIYYESAPQGSLQASSVRIDSMGINSFSRKKQPLPEISMNDFLERVIEERDRQYDGRFRAAEIAVQAALLAQKEQVAAAFSASEKAIIKAEDAQREYNARSNEFRAQLDDQAKTLMPRPETTALFRAVDEKLAVMQSNYERRLEVLQTNLEKVNESLVKEIAGLRESRSEISGKSSGANAIWGYLVAAAGLALAIAFHFIK